MVRTSTAQRYGYICPARGDELKQDVRGRGYVAHVSEPECAFERGQKDGTGGDSSSDRSQQTRSEFQPESGVRISSYSERGIFTSLLYEIALAQDALGLLRDLVKLIRVPDGSRDLATLEGAEILVEQSLSDFGDADATLLLHGADWRLVVFIEGKVKPSQVASWSIQGAWDAFLWRQDGRLDSSNLFTQLYHKVRFIHGLRTLGIDGLVQGIAFPACSTKTMRKLGSNPVVRKAAAMIGEYATDAIYVALVPDTAENLNDFFTRTLPQGPQDDITGWSTAGWGYLSWAQVEAFCEAHGLIHTLRVFRFNDGQSY